MRVLAAADEQLDERSRFEEAERILRWIAAEVHARKPALYLSAGDLLERRSTPRERAVAYDYLQAIAEVCPVVIVRGNHEEKGDIEPLSRLRTKFPIHALERPAVVEVAGAAVVCLPWPERAMLHAALGGSASSEAADQAAGDMLRAVLRGLGDQVRDFPGPRILLAHAMVRGSITSTGQPLIGQSMEVGLDDLGLVPFDLGVLGHIHRGQEWRVNGAWCGYVGAPKRRDFGEAEEKRILLAEVERGSTGIQFLPTPATPMRLYQAIYQASAPACLIFDETERDEVTGQPVWLFLPGEARGAEIRLRYECDAAHRQAAAEAAAKWKEYALSEGAAEVLVEEVVRPLSLARAPEVAAAVGLRAKLQAYWKARGIDLGAAEERVLARVAHLEESTPCS